jgi:hypothetical protein
MQGGANGWSEERGVKELGKGLEHPSLLALH